MKVDIYIKSFNEIRRIKIKQYEVCHETRKPPNRLPKASIIERTDVLTMNEHGPMRRSRTDMLNLQGCITDKNLRDSILRKKIALMEKRKLVFLTKETVGPDGCIRSQFRKNPILSNITLRLKHLKRFAL